MDPPPLKLPEAVRRDLDANRLGLADEFEATLAAHARPVVAVTSERVSALPLQRGPMGRLLGLRIAGPMLDPMESKFGGAPYGEEVEDWKDHVFLGQVDLAQATAMLPPEAGRLTGLLRIDQRIRGAGLSTVLRARWFREAAAIRAVPQTAGSRGLWETRMRFTPRWCLPEGDALDALWPLGRYSWLNYDSFWPAAYETGPEEFHQLLGHRSAGLDEPYGFTPPAGCSADLRDYEQLLRLTFDNEAGFHWGTNWFYLLVPREDLKRGNLERIAVTGANS
jgi:hypothetical protein